MPRSEILTKSYQIIRVCFSAFVAIFRAFNQKMIIRTAILSGIAVFSTLADAHAQDATLTEFQPPLRATWDQPLSAVDRAKVDLGKILYFEKRLSRDNTLSCNSCHGLDNYGVDGKKFSIGFDGYVVGRNSPTVLNAFGHIAQFWDGRASTVEEQAKGPILAGGEMAMPSPEAVVKKLKGIMEYGPLFKAAFPEAKDPLTYDNVGNAIGAFERLLATPARWDLYLQGHDNALTPIEKRGLKRFVGLGCNTCHTGTLVGGDRYQKLGLVKPWPNQKDQGRYALTKKDADKMFFKVPSLRNIEKTGPFFHDSTSTKLADAVKKMAWHQLGKELNEQDTKAIVAFLKTMTGELPEHLTKPSAPKAAKGGASFE